MSGPLIVLGWDGLDLELAERFGVAESFGAHAEPIETYVNSATGEPHTKELWPSMITGLHPDEHGITATVDGESRPDWDSDALNIAARAADYLVPQQLQLKAGRALQRRGVGQTSKTPAYYAEAGVETVVDRRHATGISIPNYQTERDRRLGLDANRDGVWAELSIDRSGDGVDFTPQVDLEEIHDIIGRELGRRVGLTIEAPLQRQYYEIAAAQTRAIRALAPDDATVVAISDHGIQNGEHTHHATVASDDRGPVAAIDHVFEAADWIRRQDPAGHGGTTVDAGEMDRVNERLADLGYI